MNFWMRWGDTITGLAVAIGLLCSAILAVMLVNAAMPSPEDAERITAERCADANS